jgi:DeoR family myo-inositol catabolism operon transcriptional repressor
MTNAGTGWPKVKSVRQKQIEKMVAQRQNMTMEELRQEFKVSINTIRADVAHLVDIGAVEKVYGGVRSCRKKEVALFDIRAAQHSEAKQAISKKASELIEDNDIVYIDNGTTTMFLIDYLEDRKNVTIITASLHIVSSIYDKVNLSLIVLPGTLNRRTNSLMDTSTCSELRKYQPNKAFMGTTGITSDGRLNVSNYLEYEIKKTAVENCQNVYLLADSSKFDESNLMSYGNLANMKGLITDHDIPPAYLEFCENNHTQVWQV